MSEFTAQEFVSISVSTYDSASLATRLTERSAEGWSVVSIVQTGTTVTAFLSRPVGGVVVGASPGAASAAAVAPSVSTAAANTATSETTAGDTSGAGTASSDTSVSDTTDTSSSEPAAAAAPAGWYADPAKRFELRYWDGTTWTEYVSRAGEQFTDPPVA